MKLSTLFGGWKGTLLSLPLVALAVPLVAPQVLAFPYSAQVGQHWVYSEMPITPALAKAVADADRKVAGGPLARARRSDQQVFLTAGGWRWQWLALGSSGALGLTRVFSENVVLNRTDPVAAVVHTGPPLGSIRPVSEVVAHEMTHGSVRAHFGRLASVTFAQQLHEGFCDYVAGGSTLSDERAEALLAAGEFHPALPYWQGRKRIEALMAQPGMTVDRLFAEWTADPAPSS